MTDGSGRVVMRATSDQAQFAQQQRKGKPNEILQQKLPETTVQTEGSLV